jgi:hypothetical protein
LAFLIRSLTFQQWMTLFQVASILVLIVAFLVYLWSFPEIRRIPPATGFLVVVIALAIGSTYIARTVRRRW